MKIVETKKAEWQVYFRHLRLRKKDEMGFESTLFYLLPSISYYRDKTFDEDGDCSFEISFNWLFWSIMVGRYWGSAYAKKG